MKNFTEEQTKAFEAWWTISDLPTSPGQAEAAELGFSAGWEAALANEANNKLPT